MTSFLKPRQREIHDEEWWLYMNPTHDSYIPFRLLIIVVLMSAILFPLIGMFMNKKINSGLVLTSLLGYSLSALVSVGITNTLKLLVGRPRPDFFHRCYPEGKKLSVICSGDESTIIEGLKSFPSGHSSLSMATFGFISLFLVAQFRLFGKRRSKKDTATINNVHSLTNQGSFNGCKFILCLLPLFGALIVCVSRLVDFHHHYEDIVTGAFIGLLVAFFTYRLYFPSMFDKSCEIPKFDVDEVGKCFSKNEEHLCV